MRLSDILEFIDPWTISQSILQSKIDHYFQLNHLRTDNIWYPDVEIIFPERLLKEENVQVILFGSFFERIFETGNWPLKKYTFWCMCSRVQSILIGTCGFPKDSVKCIPRYELFDRAHEHALLLDQPLNLVYSGRLSSQKNIEFFLAFAASMSQRYGHDIKVSLLGKWDNRIPKHRGRYVIDSYEDNILKFLQKLKFKSEPVFIQDLDSQEWLNYLKGNSLLVNFSTSIAEDYGVSVAQAQEVGCPLLISDWGGHGDVKGSNVYHVPFVQLGESFTSDEKILLFAEKLVQNFLKDSKSFVKLTDQGLTKETEHRFLEAHDFEKIRLGLLEKYGYEMGLFGQNLMSLYASSEKGKSFFNIIKKSMSGM